MKILITGDSFAAPHWNSQIQTSDYINAVNLSSETSWARLLEKTYNWQVTNLAVSGSSLEYSYFELKKSNLASYDKVIVVVTNPGRVPYNDNNPVCLHFPNLVTVEKYLSIMPNLSPVEKEHVLAAKSYYEHIYNPELTLVHFEAVLKRIIKVVPANKLILINGCCSEPSFQHYFHYYPVMLGSITDLEIPQFDFHQIKQDFVETDLHINHLTLENKVILSKVVYDLCTTGFSDVVLSDFKKMNPDDFSLYYRSNKSPTSISVEKSTLSAISKRAIAKLRNLNG